MSDADLEKKTNYLTRAIFACAFLGDCKRVISCLKDEDPELVKTILHHQWQGTESFETPLILAVRRGHYRMVDLLLSRFGVDVNQTGYLNVDGMGEITPLLCAAGNGQLDIVKLLLEKGADVNRGDSETNVTPLHRACDKDHDAVVRYLITHNADINAIEERRGQTPLMMACFSCSDSTVRFLLDNGADPNMETFEGGTAIDYAMTFEKDDVVDLLLSYGARLRVKKNGTSQLLNAGICGMERVVKCFLKHKHIPRDKKIEALEVLGATLGLDDLSRGYPYLKKGMDERFRDLSNVVSKPSNPAATCGTVQESQTLQELRERKKKPTQLLIECVLVLERAFQNMNFPDSLYIYEKAFKKLSSRGLFHEALQIHAHALVARPDKFSYLLCEAVKCINNIVKKAACPLFDSIAHVFDSALDSWASLPKWDDAGKHRVFNDKQVNAYFTIIMHLQSVARETDEHLRLEQMVKSFLAEWTKLENGLSVVELAIVRFREQRVIQNEAKAKSYFNLLKLLVRCGADVNEFDQGGNTPAHLVALYASDRHCFKPMCSVLEILVNAGAHVDIRNKDNRMPLDLLHREELRYMFADYYPLPLKCLAAAVINENNLPIQKYLPEMAQMFVRLHGKHEDSLNF